MVHGEIRPPTRNSACVFGRPIGQNQGVQFPIARAYAQMRAAELLLQRGPANASKPALPCGEQANMAKMLAAEASWAAGEACVQTHGGFGFAEEYDIERKFRETRLYQVAPDQHQPDPELCRRARVGHAAQLLIGRVLPR